MPEAAALLRVGRRGTTDLVVCQTAPRVWAIQ
jgi:hypothetical protein